jgi:hypothetical protein
VLRALWASMLLSSLVLVACATYVTDEFSEAIANGAW